ERGAAGATPVLLVVVLVIAAAGARRHDLAAGVGAANRAHPVRSPRAVAARARVQCRDADLVLGAALGGPAVRLLFLGDGHRGGKATSSKRSYFSLSSRSLAQRGSAAEHARDLQRHWHARRVCAVGLAAQHERRERDLER